VQRNQGLAPLQHRTDPPGSRTDEHVEPSHGPLVLARREHRQRCDALVGRDREALQLDQVAVEARDQDAGVGVVRGKTLRYLGPGGCDASPSWTPWLVGGFNTGGPLWG